MLVFLSVALAMPAEFDDLGLRFLYPENWTILDRGDDEPLGGVTFELPTGGFFAIETVREDQPDETLIAQVADSIAAEFEILEREEGPVEEGRRQIDFRFFYLDLLVVSRLLLLSVDQTRFLLQMQAESRDFDHNEQVFAAIVQQLHSP